MTGALRGLFAVAENYPQLKANENFLKCSPAISELEDPHCRSPRVFQ